MRHQRLISSLFALSAGLTGSALHAAPVQLAQAARRGEAAEAEA